MGTRYHGYQTQDRAVTVQSTLQGVLEGFYKVPLKVTGCSRTDAGVHAKQFFCTIEGELYESLPPERLPLALAPYLPDDIAVISAKKVEESFHPRYMAHSKEYEYYIWNEPTLHPFWAGRAWHCPNVLDVDEMNAAAALLVGEHDFKALMAQGSPVNSTVRTIHYCDVRKEAEGSLVVVRVAANGFLYNMVRIIAGTLVEVGKGKRTADSVASLLVEGERKKAGLTLPPQGLYLNKVEYN